MSLMQISQMRSGIRGDGVHVGTPTLFIQMSDNPADAMPLKDDAVKNVLGAAGWVDKELQVAPGCQICVAGDEPFNQRGCDDLIQLLTALRRSGRTVTLSTTGVSGKKPFLSRHVPSMGLTNFSDFDKFITCFNHVSLCPAILPCDVGEAKPPEYVMLNVTTISTACVRNNISCDLTLNARDERDFQAIEFLLKHYEKEWLFTEILIRPFGHDPDEISVSLGKTHHWAMRSGLRVSCRFADMLVNQ